MVTSTVIARSRCRLMHHALTYLGLDHLPGPWDGPTQSFKTMESLAPVPLLDGYQRPKYLP